MKVVITATTISIMTAAIVEGSHPLRDYFATLMANNGVDDFCLVKDDAATLPSSSCASMRSNEFAIGNDDSPTSSKSKLQPSSKFDCRSTTAIFQMNWVVSGHRFKNSQMKWFVC